MEGGVAVRATLPSVAPKDKGLAGRRAAAGERERRGPLGSICSLRGPSGDAGVATTTAVTATMGATGAGYGGRAMVRRTGEVHPLPWGETPPAGGAEALRMLADKSGDGEKDSRALDGKMRGWWGYGVRAV